MEEIKNFTCGKNEEDLWIKRWQKFGWSLMSSQEVHKNDNSFSNASDGSLVISTTTEDYIKLVFKRETKMERYQDLSNLEKQYIGQIKLIEAEKKGPGFNLFLIILFPIYIYLLVSTSKKNKLIRENNEKTRKKMSDIENRAEAIMRSI